MKKKKKSNNVFLKIYLKKYNKYCLTEIDHVGTLEQYKLHYIRVLNHSQGNILTHILREIGRAMGEYILQYTIRSMYKMVIVSLRPVCISRLKTPISVRPGCYQWRAETCKSFN